MKFALFARSTVRLLAGLFCLAALPLGAVENPPPVPLAVAESESFEAVGRLEADGLSWFVDRAGSNAPVLGATLEVEAGGKSVTAVFRPERGDYLIADAGWLAPLRAPGHHALALTLVAGEDSDLLAAELHVENAPDSPSTVKAWPLLAGGGALAVLLAVIFLGRRLRRGGVA